MNIDTLEIPLGERMKTYERASTMVLDPNQPIIVRIDGKGFSNHVKRMGVQTAYDARIVSGMKCAVEAVAEVTGGVIFAETHSDEASFLLKGYADPASEPYFGAKVHKLTSVLASIFTVHFNKLSFSPFPAYFDARAFNVPSEIEVTNYFLWRNRDCFRNAINDVARSRFSHKQLHGKNTDQKLDMLPDDVVVSLMEMKERIYGHFFINGVWTSHYSKPSFADMETFLWSSR